MDRWRDWNLPADLSGASFLEVGCWEGALCTEAVRRGARRVVGVDLCACESLRRNVDAAGFEFLQMDVFSEKFLHLEPFDVVLCTGVLYHVENVLSLLVRLRRCTKKLLVLETVVNDLHPDRPLLLFHPGDDLDRNPSSWWTPNRLCLTEMLRAAGFGAVHEGSQQVVVSSRSGEKIERLCVHAEPGTELDYRKVLPRRESLMSVQGGERRPRPAVSRSIPAP